MPRKTKKEVVIIRTNIPHYRVEFFNSLRAVLEDNEINLRLLYCNPDEISSRYGFDTDSSWAEKFNVHFFPAGMTWFSVTRQLPHSDLVIVEDASRHLVNYALYLKRFWGRPKLALWGHGWTRTDEPNRLAEWAKRWIGKQTDWYFAYTCEVKEGLIQRGYDAARITNVQNTLPPPDLSVTEAQKARLKERLGLSPKSRVALYCGRMYPSKRIDFLIAAADRLRSVLPTFVLVLIGGGPDQEIAERAARHAAHIHYLGPLFGEHKAALFALSRLVALPGLVGLNVVDAFQHGVPPVATKYPYHAPEINYLHHGENGLLTENDVEAFSKGIRRLAVDDELHAQLVAGCHAMAERITLDEMVRRFSEGILQALEL